jgi:Rrf2 family transcriptional regulator, nitric oxide-sensitive transcriptional repressor
MNDQQPRSGGVAQFEEARMRLTQFTDYALRLLMLLAAEPDRRITIQQASEFHGISRNHLMKVANRLARAGILSPSRGRNGGLALARPAEDIGVGDVLRASEPDFALVGCMAGEHCAIAANCRLVSVLEAALADFLASANCYTLADIAHGTARSQSIAMHKSP